MTKWKLRRMELRRADGMRAALLGLTLRTLADEFTELIDGTSPSEQSLDPMTFVTGEEGDERLEAIDELLKSLGESLETLGVRAIVCVATNEYLADERGRIARRLYGDGGKPDDEGEPESRV